MGWDLVFQIAVKGEGKFPSVRGESEILLGGDLFFYYWDSLHARLNSHYKAQKRLQDTENLFIKNLQLKDVC